MLQIPRFLDELVATYATLLWNIGEFAIVALGLYLVGRVVFVSIGKWALERTDLDRTMVDGFSSFLHLAAILLAVVVGASAADFRGAFAGSALVAGGVTLAVGLGAQDVLGNFVAGAFLVQDPDIGVGDRVQWENDEGIIDSIDLRVTRIRTLNNEVIVVPNSELSTSVVRNLTAHDPVGFSYDIAVQHDEMSEAMEVIRSVAADQEELLETPTPTVRVTDLLESEVVVTVRAFFSQELRSQRARIRTKFFRNVVERCHEEGIELNQSSIQELTGGVVVDTPHGEGEGVEPPAEPGAERPRTDDRDAEY